MARAPKLKVFRMAVGFHDAYVAAPSQKAAAEAWGADPSVFARKEAELVTDPELTKEPLARPGEVVKRLRGTAAEQIAALGGAEAERAPKRAPKRAEGKPAGPKPRPKKPKPRPSRAKVEEAEAALAEAKARQGAELAEIKEREAALARERAAVERRQLEEQARLEAQLEKAEAAYRDALTRWRES